MVMELNYIALRWQIFAAQDAKYKNLWSDVEKLRHLVIIQANSQSANQKSSHWPKNMFLAPQEITPYSVPVQNRLTHVPQIKKSPILSLKMFIGSHSISTRKKIFFIPSIQSKRKLFFVPSCSPSPCASTVKAINLVRGQTTIKISNRKK